MIDCSHANSGKSHQRQIDVGPTRRPDAGGDRRITGVMIESHLDDGRQDLKPGVTPTGASPLPMRASAGPKPSRYCKRSLLQYVSAASTDTDSIRGSASLV